MNTPLETRPNITEADKIRGTITRYFVQHTSTRKIYEVNRSQYNVYLKDPYYLTIELPWNITGDANSKTLNGQVILGVKDKNINIINYYNQKMQGLKRKLQDPSEYYIKS
jgi:hypothetical protein